MATENISFNVLKHELVPEHDLLPEEEVEKNLEKYKITRVQLPKIKTNDAAIKVLENVYERPSQEGSGIKIVRKSETAERFGAYRLVVGS